MNLIFNPTRRDFLRLSGGALLATALAEPALGKNDDTADVCVYCANASGIMAAVAAKREGARVLLVEPSRWLGGMTGGGLMHIDWGRQESVSGSTRGILKSGHNDPEYRAIFAALIMEHSIPVLFEHRVASVQSDGATIRSITLDFAPPDPLGCPTPEAKQPAARKITAKVFIDCSYEGDLMARAGVSDTFGREARETYGESLAGVQSNLATYDIDPYLNPGDPKSGLIPLLQDITMPAEGSADKLTMGYGFRWKFSKDPDRLPLDPPEDYDPRTFELYRRAFLGNVDIFSGRHMRKLGQFGHAGGSVYSIGAGNLSRALWAPTVFGSNAHLERATELHARYYPLSAHGFHSTRQVEGDGPGHRFPTGYFRRDGRLAPSTLCPGSAQDDLLLRGHPEGHGRCDRPAGQCWTRLLRRG